MARRARVHPKKCEKARDRSQAFLSLSDGRRSRTSVRDQASPPTGSPRKGRPRTKLLRSTLLSNRIPIFYVPAFNEDRLPANVGGDRGAVAGVDAEVIVVDDESADEAAEVATDVDAPVVG